MNSIPAPRDESPGTAERSPTLATHYCSIPPKSRHKAAAPYRATEPHALIGSSYLLAKYQIGNIAFGLDFLRGFEVDRRSTPQSRTVASVAPSVPAYEYAWMPMCYQGPVDI
ncbi:hypothetical protein EYF80_066998 [Liparis tanakae]|uniref:Uncharacterized protein n=1 Tax=Liparis tanakae TaxID=230148 RepID=A0A4Z2E1Y4_9TELE|nr:hypothetical protein EYF80_066998 [Liparis tanakae]